MKIFIGSSKESLDVAQLVAIWIEEAGHQPVRWNDPGLFLPGDYVFQRLIRISREVDAAILIFGEDDKVWYRDDFTGQPRDNVLIEYGLFAGALGQARTIMCVNGEPRTPSDLKGIIYVKISPNGRALAQSQVAAWLRYIQPQEPVVPQGGRPPRNDIADLELSVLLRMKALGIKDPDLDLYIATLTNDADLARRASDAGGDPNRPLGEVLERHHRSISHDEEYLDLLARMLRQRQ